MPQQYRYSACSAFVTPCFCNKSLELSWFVSLHCTFDDWGVCSFHQEFNLTYVPYFTWHSGKKAGIWRTFSLAQWRFLLYFSKKYSSYNISGEHVRLDHSFVFKIARGMVIHLPDCTRNSVTFPNFSKELNYVPKVCTMHMHFYVLSDLKKFRV